MVFQSARQIEVIYKEQAVIGEKPDSTGALGFRTNSGGLNLTKAPIQSGENRRDGMQSRGRHGSRDVGGSHVGDLSVGTFDALIEAIFWGTFSPAVAITEATAGMSSATLAVAANTITASAGSWITAGVRFGDVITLGTGFAAGNQGRPLRVAGVTATVLTVAETLVVEAGPIAAYSIQRPKSVIQGQTKRAFCVEEREIDIDGSEVFEWCRVSSIALALQPNGMATLTVAWVGRNMEVLEGAESPYFTDPTYTTTIGLTAVEARIMLGADEVTDITAATITMDRRAAGQPVVGSDLTPDVFDNNMAVTGQITGLRQDFSRTRAFLNEEDLSLVLLFAEKDGSGFASFVVPYFSLSTSSKSELGQDGPRTQTMDLMIGKDERGGAYEPTMVKFQTSAA